MRQVDAVVVGGGHNGLVSASMLAREGMRVVVLEGREVAGGLCASDAFHPGFRHVGIHHDAAQIRQVVVDRLQLLDHGLEAREPPPILLTSVDGPAGDRGLLLHDEAADGFDELQSVGCGEGYAALCAWIDSVRGLVARIHDEPAPRVGGTETPVWPLVQQAVAARRLGGGLLQELMRVAVTSADDWLSEYVSDPRLRAGLALPSLLGGLNGPRAPQTAGLVLRDRCVSGLEVAGGPAALVKVLLQVASTYGVEVRTGAVVRQIDVSRGVVQGVTLASGEQIVAPVVVSAVDPRRTLLDLMPPFELPPALEDEARSHRVRASSAKLHLALKGAPRFACRDGVFERFRLVSGPDHIERAMDAVKHRRIADSPVLDVRMPTVADPSLAPEGHHVLSVHIYGVPGTPETGWSGPVREHLRDLVVSQLDAVAPGLTDQVVAAELLGAPELLARYGVSGGHLMHGEHALDQLWVGRPGPRLSGHRTPIEGLVLASGGTHPGGGPSGVPGLLAGLVARESR